MYGVVQSINTDASALLLTMKKLSAFLHNLCGTKTLPKRALSGIFKLPVHSLTPDYDDPIHPKITDRFRTINC